MPNWVYNTVTIQGPRKQLDYIKSELNRPFTRDGENWDIPSQSMKTETYTYSNPIFSFWNIIRPTDLKTYQLQQDPNEDPNVMFSGNNWYDWNVRNWGTKWDVSVEDNDKYPDTELIEESDNGEDQWLVYRFNTAWSPPHPVIQKLSKLVPNCVVTLDYEEEQGWGGETEFVNGNETAHSEYESKCRDCDAEDTLDYCEDCENQICSACNWLGEADLDTVKECQTHKIYLDEEHVPDYRMEQVNG